MDFSESEVYTYDRQKTDSCRRIKKRTFFRKPRWDALFTPLQIESKETFTVFIYPEPWSFERTPDEEKQSASFPMSDDGMDSAVSWLFSMYESQKDFSQNAKKNCMHI